MSKEINEDWRTDRRTNQGYEVKGTRRDTLINKNDKPIMRL